MNRAGRFSRPFRSVLLGLCLSLYAGCASWDTGPNLLLTNFFYNDLLAALLNSSGSSSRIVLTHTGSGTAVAEGSATADSYSVTLAVRPAADVTLTVTPDAQVKANDSANASTLTFTPDDYDVAQTVSVLGAVDGQLEDAHTGSIAHSASSADPNLNGESNTLFVTVRDSSLLSGNVVGVPTFSGTPQVSTFAGSSGGAMDGIGTAAQFNDVRGITTDGTNLYVADTDNHTIRRIVIDSRAVTTLAGSAMNPGSADDTGAAARFNGPRGITTDGTNLYVADTGNHTIRRIVIDTGAVTTLAGLAGASGSFNGTGSFARFDSPEGITTDGVNLYVADRSNHTIRQVVIATGAVTTLAGLAGVSGSTDSTGILARFNQPRDLTTDGVDLFVTDLGNASIRKVGIESTQVTTHVNGLVAPRGIATDGTNLYFSDNEQIKFATIAGSGATVIAGTGASGSADGNALAAATFASPWGLVSDGSALYVADSNNDRIRVYQ